MARKTGPVLVAMATVVDSSSSLKELKAECTKRKIDTCLFIEKSEYIEALHAHKYYEEERTGDGAHAHCHGCGSGEDSPGNDILLCDSPRCPEAWHLQCLRPRLTAVPSGTWLCAQPRPLRLCVPCSLCSSVTGESSLFTASLALAQARCAPSRPLQA